MAANPTRTAVEKLIRDYGISEPDARVLRGRNVRFTKAEQVFVVARMLVKSNVCATAPPELIGRVMRSIGMPRHAR